MDAFSPNPPQWIESATHATEFCCPKCRSSVTEALRVWINRRSPVITDNYRRKWQEFYECQCGCAWWGWSSDRPPSEFADRDRLDDQLDDF